MLSMRWCRTTSPPRSPFAPVRFSSRCNVSRSVSVKKGAVASIFMFISVCEEGARPRGSRERHQLCSAVELFLRFSNQATGVGQPFLSGIGVLREGFQPAQDRSEGFPDVIGFTVIML